MPFDWLFQNESNICSFRTVGVLLRNHKILVQRERDGTEYALPGGHVQIGETSEEALIREYKEETGAEIVLTALFGWKKPFGIGVGKMRTPSHFITLYP